MSGDRKGKKWNGRIETKKRKTGGVKTGETTKGKINKAECEGGRDEVRKEGREKRKEGVTG